MAEFEEAGVQIVLMAAQRRFGHHGAEKYAKRTKPPFPFLVDPDRSVTRSYGIDATSPLGPKFSVPHPAAFLIDRQGMIRFLQVLDLKSRPDPAHLLEESNKLGET